MTYYKDEDILKQAEARLSPPDERYDECTCLLLLTEKHFFVLEDNYDSTWNEHFKIPLTQITEMKLSYDTLRKPVEHRISTALAHLISLICGMILLQMTFRRRTRSTEQLVVISRTSTGNETRLYFHGFGADLDRLVRTFRKQQDFSSYSKFDECR